MSKSRIKTMIIVFFDIRGIVHCEFVSQGQTVNSVFHLEVLRRLKRRISRVRTDIKDTVKLHHDNATSHTAFLAWSNNPLIPDPPYSLDLAPCDFFLFPRLKREMKGKHWETVENIQHHVTTFLRSIPVEEFQDEERPGAPPKFEVEVLEAILDEDPTQTQKELALTLFSLGVGNWVPYELKPRYIKHRFYPSVKNCTNVKKEKVKQTSVTKHKIETGNHQPIKHRPYRVSPTEHQAIQTEVDKMLDAGIICHSESPWSSPVILVKKKDGNWRFCVDYRRLNKSTKQIEKKTAFITPDGLYEFLVMPFGLCNAPATFERMMDKILKGLKWTMALCYLDDIVVYSKSFNEHLHPLEIILQCLDKAELRLNPKKCLFGSKRIRVFGHLVDSKGIYPDPEKIEAIAKFPTPNFITDVRSFIGLCSYYRRFIENFAKKAAPLHEVLKKDNKFTWNSDQQDAFDFLKKALMSEPFLAYFEEQLPTELHTDASGYGIGAVLVQINDGKERPVGYAPRTLSKAEKNYSTTERECLATI
ncbi:K02A2.6-like [Cordylochernes scorpioides]|uniref:K02A2.6-like n=1 Tax=Cordylochernes scorpioides TaxID=51811 RepID=A0ABY6KP44_9ARAC|nr:K02A2.6-like [Cordylochernes scorpioides]